MKTTSYETSKPLNQFPISPELQQQVNALCDIAANIADRLAALARADQEDAAALTLLLNDSTEDWRTLYLAGRKSTHYGEE